MSTVNPHIFSGTSLTGLSTRGDNLAETRGDSFPGWVSCCNFSFLKGSAMSLRLRRSLPLRARPTPSRRRLFETLETRCVLALNAYVQDNLLFITGDDGPNKLDVTDMLAGGVSVMCDGHDLNKEFNKGEPWIVNGVTLNTFGGDDTIKYDVVGPDQPPAVPPDKITERFVYINAGDGHDSVAALLNEQGAALLNEQGIDVHLN